METTGVKEEIKDLFILAYEKACADGKIPELLGVMMSSRDKDAPIDPTSTVEGVRDATNEMYTFEAVCGRRKEWAGEDFDGLVVLLKERLSRLNSVS